MDTPQSRGQESGISDWTSALDSFGGTPPPAPKLLPLQTRRGTRRGTATLSKAGGFCNDNDYDGAGQCARGEEKGYDDDDDDDDEVQMQHRICLDGLDERLRERLKTTVCWMSPDGTSRSQRASAPHSGPRHRTLEDADSNTKAVSKVRAQRQRPSDTESFRLLESSAPTSCMPRRQRAKSKFEALSDSESLRILEYWTQKRSGEKNWE